MGQGPMIATTTFNSQGRSQDSPNRDRGRVDQRSPRVRPEKLFSLFFSIVHETGKGRGALRIGPQSAFHSAASKQRLLVPQKVYDMVK